MKYAIVKDGVVVNLIEYETQPATPPDGLDEGHTAIQSDDASIGWVYANGEFTDPNPPAQTAAPKSFLDLIAEDPVELAKFKATLGITS